MAYRELTPPTTCDFDPSMQCPGGSASTVDSAFPQDWSPASVLTSATTPPRSPWRLHESGPSLLPRVRCRDQLVEPASAASYHGHNRTISLPVNGGSVQFGGRLPPRPGMERRSTSPPTNPYDPSTAFPPSPFQHLAYDIPSSKRPSLANCRTYSGSDIRSHSRNTSTSSVDASMLSRYGYPTYRHSPAPQPMPGSRSMSRTPSAMCHLAPIAMPDGQVQSYPQRRRTASPPANPSRLSSELELDPVLDFDETTTIDYLTAPNPAPLLTQRTIDPIRGQSRHFWFDVRNVKAWSDFKASTISSVDPELLKLLNFSVPRRNLPNPAKVNTNPETPAQLIEACAAHHAVRVNAALKLTQGKKHMVMQTLKSKLGSRQQPEFVSNYHCDAEKTIYGDGRGRVVGIVKCWEQWNTGMRHSSPPTQTKYLAGLAQLQFFMLEHGTRYGFIMTETELVCVRAGGPPQPTNVNTPPNVPLFGFLEVSPAIQISSSGRGENESLEMTAGLALWWLHMLASRDQPWSGQYHWKLDVGAPTARTRQYHLARDAWMPKWTVLEKREAKRVRGWVMPEEPLSRKECGRTRRKAQ